MDVFMMELLPFTFPRMKLRFQSDLWYNTTMHTQESFFEFMQIRHQIYMLITLLIIINTIFGHSVCQNLYDLSFLVLFLTQLMLTQMYRLTKIHNFFVSSSKVQWLSSYSLNFSVVTTYTMFFLLIAETCQIFGYSRGVLMGSS